VPSAIAAPGLVVAAPRTVSVEGVTGFTEKMKI